MVILDFLILLGGGPIPYLGLNPIDPWSSCIPKIQLDPRGPDVMTKTLDPCTILEYIFNLFKIRLGKVHKLIILWVLEQTHVRKG